MRHVVLTLLLLLLATGADATRPRPVVDEATARGPATLGGVTQGDMIAGDDPPLA